MAVSGKRKRGAAFSAHDKLAHQSSVLLQREAKKVRAFLVRKAVQQLKQQRAQLAEAPTAGSGASADDKRQRRQHKLQASIARLEREHAELKALDLQAVVARARLQTGLDQPAMTSNDAVEHEHEAFDSDDDAVEHQLADSESEGESDGEPSAEPATVAGAAEAQSAEPAKAQQELVETLMDRVLAHKQMTPLLDAVRTRVAQEERASDKRRRAAEKRALNRGRQEELVGGRSSSAPTSLFLGSLSGRGGLDEDELALGAMEAEDDIAEFLGEKKKRKNRPGQMARRQKALRQEEAQRRKEERAQGIFRPFVKPQDAKSSVSKYGPSERPKKAKPKGEKPRERKKASSRDVRTERKPEAKTPVVARAKTEADPSAHPSWLAKQKQKEKEQLGLNAFSGKKITFD